MMDQKQIRRAQGPADENSQSLYRPTGRHKRSNWSPDQRRLQLLPVSST